MKKMAVAAVILLTIGFFLDQVILTSEPKQTLQSKVDSALVFSGLKAGDVMIVSMKEQGQLTTCSLDGKVLINKNMMDQFDTEQINELVINTHKLCKQALLQ